MPKIKKEEFDLLYSDEITKKEYDRILSKMDTRLSEIVKALHKNSKAPKNPRWWFDYGNVDYRSEDTRGYFDPKEYKTETLIGGEYLDIPEPYGGYGCDSYFPTRWFWEDFEEEMKSEIKKEKERLEQEEEKKKTNVIKNKQKKKTVLNTITSKLTKDEIKYLSKLTQLDKKLLKDIASGV